MTTKQEAYAPPDDVLMDLLRPDTTRDERKAAILKLAEGAFSAGWDACMEESIVAIQDAAKLLGRRT